MCLLAAAWAAAYAGSALIVLRPLARPDAIVSLASHEWERLPLVARLAAEHPDAAVLLTVPKTVTPHNCHDCAHRVDRLRHLGVAAERVRQVSITAEGTYGEALAALAFARDAGIRHLLVATSPYHTRRALAVFRTVFDGTGIAVGVEPATASSPARPSWWWLAPYDRAYVAYEWAAIAYYAAKYDVFSW